MREDPDIHGTSSRDTVTRRAEVHQGGVVLSYTEV